MWIDDRERINLKKEIKTDLDSLKKDLGFRTNNQIIVFLIDFYKNQTCVFI